ncbi:MAG: carbon storage regulator [Planctomycetota bacterium]
MRFEAARSRRTLINQPGRRGMHRSRRRVDPHWRARMLVLTRNRDQSISLSSKDGTPIGDIKVVEVRGSRVKVGLTFSDDIKIERTETQVRERQAS